MDVKIKLDDDFLASLLTSAAHPGISFWSDAPKNGNPARALKGEVVTIHELDAADGGKRKKHTLTKQKILKGLAIMAEKYPHAFGEIVEQNSDTYTGGLLIQCALFGEEKYA